MVFGLGKNLLFKFILGRCVCGTICLPGSLKMGVALQLVFVEQQRAIAIINVAVLHNGMIKIMMYHFYFHAYAFLKFVCNFDSELALKYPVKTQAMN